MFEYKDKKRLIPFTDRLLLLNSKLNLGTQALTPLNYTQEKEKFFRSDTYNPQFIYELRDTSIMKRDLYSLQQELHTIHLQSDLRDYISDYLQSVARTIDCIDAIGTPRFAKAANLIFTFEEVDGKKFLQNMPFISFNKSNACVLQNAEEMAETFRKYISNAQLSYDIQIDYQNDHIIRVGHNKLIIGAKVKRLCSNVKRLIVHEIESHIFQRHNLLTAQNPLLRIIPHADSMLWGEGLAVYNEIQSGTITQSAYETYYYRVKAVEMLHKSFREIFDYLSRYVTAEKAYMITYRVKRGMGDTSLPGGYAKDASYAIGYQTVDNYIRNNGCLELLYTSRVPHIGELLLEHELLEPSVLKLPTHTTLVQPKPQTNPFVFTKSSILTS
ncbi:MAG TPA: DUF1704 domain-containing protein [Candidatus Levybacteria bacterium]|nr:DUF1704 domain-containing protein [Candidatus Levybacteria bacterium]